MKVCVNNMTTATLTKADTLTIKAAILDNLLAGANLATNKDKSLTALKCVMLEARDGSIIAAATDRYRIHEGRAGIDDAEFRRVLITRDDATKIRAFIKDKIKASHADGITITADSNDLITVSDLFHNSITCRGQVANFPPYEHLIPTEFNATDTIGLNPAFLADLAKIPGVGKKLPMMLKLNGPGKPMLAEVAGEVFWRVLIMPMRVSS
jgi:DNA polymerase III sliding clamp (beta) subunit (PCNA family)